VAVKRLQTVSLSTERVLELFEEHNNSDLSSTKESDLERQHQNSSNEIGLSCCCV